MSLNIVLVALALVAILLVMALAGYLTRRRPGKINKIRFAERWKEVHGLCGNQSTWPLAIINADKLLDDALKTLRFKGHTMGERMVAAQHDLSDNDAVWFAHKLRNKLVHEHVDPLTKKQVQYALKGFQQALKDLRAL